MLLAALALPARAATLDVVASGDDLVFTWDAVGPQDLLRGPTPDALVPWRTGVTTPHVENGENALRGEHAFYRLASGSNMGMRVERTISVPDPSVQLYDLVTLPERRALVTAGDVLAAWPTCSEVWWWDSVDGRYESLARIGGTLLGDDEPLPAHGAVALAFPTTTTITLVGSDDPLGAGYTVGDAAAPWWRHLPVPPATRLLTLLDVACGERGTDWQDADANGWPDLCGRDLDSDGDLDTGLWAQSRRATLGVVRFLPTGEWEAGFRVENGDILGVTWTTYGTDVPSDPPLDRGAAWVVTGTLGGSHLDLPWRPPSW